MAINLLETGTVICFFFVYTKSHVSVPKDGTSGCWGNFTTQNQYENENENMVLIMMMMIDETTMWKYNYCDTIC